MDRSKVSQQAEKLVAQGKIDAAIIQYETLVKDNPRDMNTVNKIGDLYARLGRKKEAVLQFNKIGEHYAKDGFLLKAIAIYKKITKIDPTHLDSYQRLADLNAQQGLVLEARSQYEMVTGQYIRAGDVKNAIRACQGLVKTDPENVKHRGLLADLLAKDGKTAEAVEELVRIGDEMGRKGLDQEAKSAFQKAAQINPHSPALVARLASARAAGGDVMGAIGMTKEALRKPGASVDLSIILGDLQTKAGLHQEALSAFGGALDTAPDRSDVRLRLARTHLALGDASAAFETVAPHSSALLKEGKGEELAALIEEVSAVDPSQAQPLRRLSEIYSAMKDEENSLRCASRLLEIWIEREDLREGRRLAESLVRRRPEDPMFREKLDRILRMEAAASRDTAVVSPAVETTRAAMAAIGEAPAAMVEETGGAYRPSEEMGAPGEANGFDSGRSEARRASQVVDAGVIPALDLPAPPQLESEDEDFIAEHMTEADVFVKYGLSDRAVEQLQTVIERYPGYAPAHQKLKDVYLEEGNRDGARREMVMLVKSHLAAGDSALAQEALADLRSFEPDSLDAAQLAEAIQPEDVPAASESSARLEQEGTAFVPGGESGAAESLEAIEESEPGEPETEERAPTAEEMEEVDFYIRHGLRDEAVGVLRRLATSYGSHPEIVSRMRTAVVLQPGQTSRAGASGASDSGSYEEEFEIAVVDEVEDPQGEELPPAPALMESGSMGDADADLKDLAAEIDAALSGQPALEEVLVEGADATPEGSSLDEIVHAFKKGIEQQVSVEDFDTHYSLGIAYKEMGLIDEAIGEFQFASKSERLLVDCCSMLGICFREKSMASLAVKWYRRGIEASQAGDEETMLGLRYDLAELLAEMGQHREALDLYTEIFGINSKYRDVAARIRELKKTLKS